MALKSFVDIERDFFRFIERSELGQSIKGGIFRKGNRDKNRREEDITIGFLAGMDTQRQTGTIVVNVYIPSILDNEGLERIDYVRVGQLSNMLMGFIVNFIDFEYKIESEASAKVTRDEAEKQYVLSSRIKFVRMSI